MHSLVTCSAGHIAQLGCTRGTPAPTERRRPRIVERRYQAADVIEWRRTQRHGNLLAISSSFDSLDVTCRIRIPRRVTSTALYNKQTACERYRGGTERPASELGFSRRDGRRSHCK